MQISANNKKIAVNTVLLYGRMLFCMVLSFYTTRIVLQALGVVDYGLVNAIGGVVGMFSFISIPLSTSCSRFFSYDLGKNDFVQLGRTFSQMLILYLFGALLIVGLVETIGLWYMKNKLVLPENRFAPAMIYFQLTVATLVANWFSVPYSSLIISYENMAAYAGLSIFDAVIRLSAAGCVLLVRSMDGLVFYGVLLLVAVSLHTLANYYFARHKYPACKFKWHFDRAKFKYLCSFNGWQLFGALAWTSSEVFVNLLLNAFFGPVVNAARGIAAQVMSGVFGFTSNFLTAARPQIVKLWAAGDKIGFYNLLKRTSKIGYFLVLFMSMPLLFELDSVLAVWLKEVPEHAVAFTKIIIVTSLVNTFSHPIVYAAQAVGRIALFEGLGSGIRVLVWPLSWVALNWGCGPETVFYIALGGTAFCVLLRFLILVRLTGVSLVDFLFDVFVRMAIVSLIVYLIVVCPYASMPAGIFRFVVVGMVSSLSVIVVFGLFGFNRQERGVVLGFLAAQLEKLRRRIR